MEKVKNILCTAFSVLLCLSFVLSIADTVEFPTTSDFNHQNIRTHIDKICETGVHSITDAEENALAQEYIISVLEELGLSNSDTTEKPAYLVQEFVTAPNNHQNFTLENVIVHIPANAEAVTNQAVMVMAHFDSAPTGQGASDDAVACGTMLEAIRYYLDRMNNGYKIANDLVFCFVNCEEYGLLGSAAFMNEFKGFNNLVERINFAINLEARGTAGTQIMFETSSRNYNTVKLFCEVNNNLFTCSVATMIYDMMPNGTDFSNLKPFYQGVNMANISQGENYHTQNDNPENIKENVLTQQARIINKLLDKLGNYDLYTLYEAEESAIFFSYLNICDFVYTHNVSKVLAVIGIVLLAANIVLGIVLKRKALLKTLKSFLVVIAGLALTTGATFGCYYLFQLIAALCGTIDFGMVGSVTFSNTAIIVGIGILALGVTALTSHFGCKLLKIGVSDIIRAFSYIHIFLGVVLTFVLPDASYLFIFSGLMLMINQIIVTIKPELADCHFELIAEALYMPIVIPIIVLATSALGLGMCYVFGLLFALSIFAVGACIAPLCGYFSVNFLIAKDKSKPASGWVGALHIIGVSFAVFLGVSLCKPNAHVNLGGKQGTGTQMNDDALIYCVGDGYYGYQVFDLSAYPALKKYCPEMTFDKEMCAYSGTGEEQKLSISPLSTAEGNVLKINLAHENSMVNLVLLDVNAESLTLDDGINEVTYDLEDTSYKKLTIHSDCTLTLNGGSATAVATEYIVDYPELIPENYDKSEKLHFNLWMVYEFELK